MNYKQDYCLICQATQTKYLFPAGSGELIECRNCKLVYFTPRPTPEELSQFYNSASYREEFQHSIMSGQSFTQNRYKELKKIINHYEPSLLKKSNPSFLDIGCGTGDLLSIAASDGWDITGTEISPIAVEKANIKLNNKVLCGDIFSLDLPENYYDVITIYHVIEHLISPVETLARIKELLKPKGVAFIETPNIDSLGAKIKGKDWSHIIPPEHITYFCPVSLRYALEKAGFHDTQIFTASPQMIESINNWSPPFKAMATLIYRIAPLINMGAALQAVAFKPEKL